MTIVTDSLGDWEQLGEITVNNQWQQFEVPAINYETFRITTTIVNQQDWDELKIRSASYIRFSYPDGSKSPKHYVSVSQSSIIKDFLIPVELKNNGIVTRYVECILSHPKINRYSLASFAQWKLKLEALT